MVYVPFNNEQMFYKDMEFSYMREMNKGPKLEYPQL